MRRAESQGLISEPREASLGSRLSRSRARGIPAYRLTVWLSLLFAALIGCRGQSEMSEKGGPRDTAPPAAFLDTPRERSTVPPKFIGTGWALDESGIREVKAVLENGSVVRVITHLPHPGVAEAHPGVPGGENAGFAVQIPDVPTGWHTLTVTSVANDGGKSVITRSFRVG
jgi:hypothetical protein